MNRSGRFDRESTGELRSTPRWIGLGCTVELGFALTARNRSGGVALRHVGLNPEALATRSPSLVEQGYIVPHQIEDFGRVGAIGTRALDVDLAAEWAVSVAALGRT